MNKEDINLIHKRILIIIESDFKKHNIPKMKTCKNKYGEIQKYENSSPSK